MSAPSIPTSKSALSNFKRWLLVALLVGLGVAVGAFLVCTYLATQPIRAINAAPDAELLWLRSEFKLTDAQFAQIKSLHEKYSGQCGVMCGEIAGVNARLDHLISEGHEVTPELSSAMDEAVRVQANCRRAMLTHIYSVAGNMDPPQAARYVQMMKGMIIQPGLPSTSPVSAPSSR
jgi:hypothetical protein